MLRQCPGGLAPRRTRRSLRCFLAPPFPLATLPEGPALPEYLKWKVRLAEGSGSESVL